MAEVDQFDEVLSSQGQAPEDDDVFDEGDDQETLNCLMCAHEASGPTGVSGEDQLRALLAHMNTEHSFDLVELIKSRNSTVYDVIATINSIRSGFARGLVTDAASVAAVLPPCGMEDPFELEVFLKPIFADDGLLSHADGLITMAGVADVDELPPVDTVAQDTRPGCLTIIELTEAWLAKQPPLGPDAAAPPGGAAACGDDEDEAATAEPAVE